MYLVFVVGFRGVNSVAVRDLGFDIFVLVSCYTSVLEKKASIFCSRMLSLCLLPGSGEFLKAPIRLRSCSYLR